MSASTWQHAAVAVTALAGEDGPTLDVAFVNPSGVIRRRAHIAAGEGASHRARRILAERLRALTPRPAGGAPLGARVYALWLLGSDAATRAALARILPPRSLLSVRAEAGFARRHAAAAEAVAGVMGQCVRALRGAPSIDALDALGGDLVGFSPAWHPDALRMERSLRAHGLRDAAATLFASLAEAAT